MKYACIAQHRGAYPVRLMCRVLEVAPSGFYDAQQRAARGPGPRAAADRVLTAQVVAVHAASGGTYGVPRVRQELRAQGTRAGRTRIGRVMRAAGLHGQAARRRAPRTTASRHTRPVAPNHLARQFAVRAQGGLDRVWVSDLTYVPTREGWLYLATVLDLASRRVVGWAMGPTLEGELALRALRMALTLRQPAPGLLHHSDRGVQYAAADYQALLAAHGAVASMSRKANCWDNAVAESFFATLERECMLRQTWRTRDEAQRAIFRYIEIWYNRQRRHSSLGYCSPVAYEAQLIAA